MSNTITFKHSGNTGDIIYALAGIKAVCERLNNKAIICIWLDRPGHYYEGAKHPLGEVTMNKYMFDMLRPLLLDQAYIHDVIIWEGEKILIDLDLIRQDFVNMPYGHIARWYFYRFPDMNCDLGKAWLSKSFYLDKFTDIKSVNLDLSIKDSIVINRTSRYRNPHISYAFLRKYDERVLFVGTKDEFEVIKKEIPNIFYASGVLYDFKHLAWLISECKVFIGNQSMCFALAEAMKTPRILELCSFAPNVIVQGDGPAYDFYTQHAFEYYVDQVMS